MTIVLADLGGTYLKLAQGDTPLDVSLYKIDQHVDFVNVIRAFAPTITRLYLATAIMPLDGIIADKRFKDPSYWQIDIRTLPHVLNLQKLTILNDLEAAAYSIPHLTRDDYRVLLDPQKPQLHFSNPPKILIGIGTGIGHAFIHPSHDGGTVRRTHGGHVPAFGMTEEHHHVIQKLRAIVPTTRDVIMEDIVSGTGLLHLKAFYNASDAVRLFWEFLGLYTNMMVSLSGAYGGVYLTGGVLHHLYEDGTVDIASFEHYFLRPMVRIVEESMQSVPVLYSINPYLPVLGLYHYARKGV